MMKRRIGAGEFKAKCLRLIDEVHASGKDIVITKRGRALARLVPAEDKAPQIFGRMAAAAGVHGILYPSSKDDEKQCLALFPQKIGRAHV